MAADHLTSELAAGALIAVQDKEHYMNALKDVFLAVAWTVTAWPKKIARWAGDKVDAVRELWPAVVNELVSQSWTVFGLLVGWIVLPDGETRDFVGIMLLWLCVAWLVTMPLRISRED